MANSAAQTTYTQYAFKSRKRALAYRAMGEEMWEREAWVSARHWLSMAKMERDQWANWETRKRVA